MTESALAEGKEFLTEINNAIDRTKNKSWQLMAFLIGIDAYFAKFFIETGQNSMVVQMAIFSIPISLAMFYFLSKAMLPIETRLNGCEPRKIKQIISNNYLENMAHTIQKSIDFNTEIHSKITKKYVISLVLMVIFLIGTISIFLFNVFTQCC